MQTESVERPVPFTSNRALTELVHSRQQWTRRADPWSSRSRSSAGLDHELRRALPLRALEGVLGQLEEAEAALWESAQ